MRFPPLLILLSSAALVSAAAAPEARAGGLPLCNAKHKRPANAFGSVLSGGVKATVTSAQAGSGGAANKGVGAAPASPGSAQKISQADLRASFAPCGSDRA